MVIRCAVCGRDSETGADIVDGQHVRCPFCGEKSTYRKPSRIDLPAGFESQRRIDGRASGEKKPPEQASEPLPASSPCHPQRALHVIRPHGAGTAPANLEGKRRRHMAEDHVRFYEEMKSLAHRRKLWSNVVNIVVLVMLVGGGLGGYAYFRNLREKKHQAELAYAAEKIRIEAERAEAEHQREIRRAAEQKAEQERRAKEESERRAMEEAKKKQAEQEALEAKIMYRRAIALFRDGEFRFAKSTPDERKPGEVDGVTYYLLPFLENGEIVVCTAATNGILSAYRLNEVGVRVPVEAGGILSSLEGNDYLMARDDTVYFHSKREKPHIGQISKTEVVDLPKSFFGDVAQEVRRLDIDPEGLSFEVVFIPRNSKKIIISERIEYGASYSLDKVREAVEEAFPMKTAISSVSRGRQKQFKRTTVFWDGAHIKKGVDGVTYVPRVAPPVDVDYGYGNVTVRGPGWDYSRASRNYYKARRRAAYTREQWQALHDEAVRQEEAERKHYEQQDSERLRATQAKLTEAEKKYAAKIDKIMEDGTLYYRAKISDKEK